jgi:hypothetical protein
MALMTIEIKSYPVQAKNLVDIWSNYATSNMGESGIEFITFIKKRPKNPKTQNRRIAGLPAQCISYLENFIYLMAKSGVVMDIKEEQRNDE